MIVRMKSSGAVCRSVCRPSMIEKAYHAVAAGPGTPCDFDACRAAELDRPVHLLSGGEMSRKRSPCAAAACHPREGRADGANAMTEPHPMTSHAVVSTG